MSVWHESHTLNRFWNCGNRDEKLVLGVLQDKKCSLVKMQKYDDKDNDDGEHHDGEVDGLHVKVQFHDEVSTSAPPALLTF